LFVIAAPSGAGKTTLVHALLERRPELRFSISYTTRSPRPAERDGHDYFFVPEAEFDRMVASGAFLEHAQVFDNWYGTSRAHVDSILATGHSVLLEIDWQGARQVRGAMPEAVSIFILPPSVAVLEQRLRGRAADSEATIARRLRDALSDMSHWAEFDFAIVNDDLDAAVAALTAVVDGAGEAHSTREPALRRRIEDMLSNQTRDRP
jgi:guanylate kinase